jgi:hypothetical protein
MSVGSAITKVSGPGSDQRKVLIQRYLKDEVRSNRSSSSIASLGSNRLKKQNAELRNSGILERSTLVGSHCSWQFEFPEKIRNDLGTNAMDREVDRQVGCMRCCIRETFTGANLPKKVRR